MWSQRLRVREEATISLTLMMVEQKVFHIDDGVMLDSIRPIPVTCA